MLQELRNSEMDTILFIIFCNFKILQYWSDSLQVKQSRTSIIANLVNKLPYKLPNNFRRLTISKKSQDLRKYQKNSKSGRRHQVIAGNYSQNVAKVDTGCQFVSFFFILFFIYFLNVHFFSFFLLKMSFFHFFIFFLFFSVEFQIFFFLKEILMNHLLIFL